jgi:hypothetical protein
VCDTLRASYITEGNKSLPAFQPGIMLRRLDDEPQDSTNSIVHCLARDLGAHMITLKLDELDDLSRDFLGQNPKAALNGAASADEIAAPTGSNDLDQGDASKECPTEGCRTADSTPPDHPSLDSNEERHPTMFLFVTRSARKAEEDSKKWNQTAMNSLLHALQTKAKSEE